MRLTRKAVLGGLASLAMAGAAMAAEPGRLKTMNVALPDGSFAQIAYRGEKPRIVLADALSPLPTAWPDLDAPFALMERIAAEMDRQMGAMLRLADLVPGSEGGAPGLNLAAAAQMPAGTVSYSVVATSDGRGTCSRSTRVTSLGSGQAPKVETRLSGDCARATAEPAAAPAPQQAVAPAPPRAAEPLTRT